MSMHAAIADFSFELDHANFVCSTLGDAGCGNGRAGDIGHTNLNFRTIFVCREKNFVNDNRIPCLAQKLLHTKRIA